ncbi:DUF2461 domain-containing protein [Brevundimonas sp.]|uniref:DUF2461 domain-containing protein n=1 Tax=Brevundimonas sp. TaxID=1871086 RepID=UPI002FD8BDDD
MDHDRDRPWPEGPRAEMEAAADGDRPDPAPWLSPFYHRDDPDEIDDDRRSRPSRRASARVWGLVREDYLAGETAPEVCRRWGVKVATLRARASAEGWRRADFPEPDPEPVPRAPEPPQEGLDALSDGPADYAAMARRALARFERALSRGRAADAATWLRLHARLRDLARDETAVAEIDSIDSIDAVFSDAETPSVSPATPGKEKCGTVETSVLAPPETPPMAFTGFTPADLAFLTGLRAHNDRDWFTENRAAYDEGLKPGLAALILALNAALAARGLPLAGDPKASQFRIHRDTRFSKDKRPYKTHVSATLTRDGKKMSPGMVYVHVEPPASDADPHADPLALHDDPHGHGPFAAAGFYLDERADVDAFRAAVAADPQGWAGVEAALAAAGLRLDPGDPVKRMPKGFEGHAGGPLEAVLKRTRWIVSRPLTQAEVQGADLPEVIAGFVAAARPLLEFGWRAFA